MDELRRVAEQLGEAQLQLISRLSIITRSDDDPDDKSMTPVPRTILVPLAENIDDIRLMLLGQLRRIDLQLRLLEL